MDPLYLYRRFRWYLQQIMRDWEPLTLRVLRILDIRTTTMGRSVIFLTGTLGVMTATVGINWPIYYLPVALFSALVCSLLISHLFFPRARVDRELPERCMAGSTLSVSARVSNVGRLPIFDLAVTEQERLLSIRSGKPQFYLSHLRPGASAELTYSLEFKRRGVYDFMGPVALTGFPFRLLHAARRCPALHRIRVYPRWTPLKQVDLPLGRKHQPGGLRLESHLADSEEFIGNREYRSGDRLIHLDHAAWARLGIPIVHEFQQEFLCRIALILDTQAPRHTRQEMHAFEAAISLIAGLADALGHKEHVIDLFAAGPDVYHFQLGRGLSHMDNLLDILACIEARWEGAFSELEPAILEEIRELSAGVVVLLDWDATREIFVQGLIDLGVSLKVIVVRDGLPSLRPSGAVPVTILTPAEVEKGVDRL